MDNLESFNEIDNYFNLEELNIPTENNSNIIESQNNLEINNSQINDTLGDLKCNVEPQNISVKENKDNKSKEETDNVNNILKILEDDDFYNPKKSKNR